MATVKFGRQRTRQFCARQTADWVVHKHKRWRAPPRVSLPSIALGCPAGRSSGVLCDDVQYSVLPAKNASPGLRQTTVGAHGRAYTIRPAPGSIIKPHPQLSPIMTICCGCVALELTRVLDDFQCRLQGRNSRPRCRLAGERSTMLRRATRRFLPIRCA